MSAEECQRHGTWCPCPRTCPCWRMDDCDDGGNRTATKWAKENPWRQAKIEEAVMLDPVIANEAKGHMLSHEEFEQWKIDRVALNGAHTLLNLAGIPTHAMNAIMHAEMNICDRVAILIGIWQQSVITRRLDREMED